MTDSIHAYNRYYVSPTYLRFMINNIFYFPNSHKDTLTLYFSETCPTHQFLDAMKDGMIYNEGIEYQVIYHKTDPSRLLRRRDYSSVKMSFRVVDPIFHIIPTVLVKEIKTS